MNGNPSALYDAVVEGNALDTFVVVDPIPDRDHTFFYLKHSFRKFDALLDKSFPVDGLPPEEVADRVMSLTALGFYSHAVTLCTKALKRFPECCDLWAFAIKLHIMKCDYASAGCYYNNMKNAVPIAEWSCKDYIAAFEFLFHGAMENESECREVLEHYRRSAKDDGYPLILTAKLEYALKNYDACYTILRNLGDLTALRFLINYQLRHGDYAQAISVCKELIAQHLLSSDRMRYQIRLMQLYAMDKLFYKDYTESIAKGIDEGNRLIICYNRMIEESEERGTSDHFTLEIRKGMVEKKLWPFVNIEEVSEDVDF